MENAQLALLFLCGFLLSRLLVKARAPDFLVGRLFDRALTVSRIVLYLLAVSALLSVFIPNAITAVTLIPVLLLLREKLLEQGCGGRATVTTALALTVIYGANIGGIASITATPANGILVAYAALRGTPDRGVLRFDGWLLWGVPLSILLVVLAWAVLVLCLRDLRWFSKVEPLHELAAERHNALGAAFKMSLAFFTGSFLLSAAMHAASGAPWVLGLTVTASTVFVAILFVRRGEGSAPLLTLTDCVSALPWRGLGLVAIIILLGIVAGLFGAIERSAAAAATVLPADLGNILAFTWITTLTSFTTQVMSNTIAQLAMFETINAHAGVGELGIYLLLVVTLSSTCAFMTPIATGVNGLVYGELEGVSLAKMLFVGVVMNLVAAVVIAAWVFYLVA